MIRFKEYWAIVDSKGKPKTAHGAVLIYSSLRELREGLDLGIRKDAGKVKVSWEEKTPK